MQTPIASHVNVLDLPQSRQTPTKKVEIERNMFLA